MAEGEWPKQARAALVELCGAGSADSTEICIRLLADIKSIFGTADQLQTEVLLGSLMALSESPWREYNRNGPITPKQLAELLEDFGPHPRKIHVWEGAKRLTLRGYLRSDFQDAWERYPLPEEAEEENEESGPVSAEPAKSTIHPPHPPQPNVYAGPGDFPHPPHEGSGAGRKSEESPINTRGGARGADEIPNTQAEDDSADVEPWLTPEELAKYAGHDVPQEVSALPQDWTPTDADSLDEDEEAD
jgi:hypothetical protein